MSESHEEPPEPPEFASEAAEAEPLASTAAGLAAKAHDLGELRTAVVEAANVGTGLWLSYLFVLFYFLVAVGGVSHRNLLFENPVRLPFLNVDLPLIGFFALGPLIFLIVHAYVLLHFVLLATKIGIFDSELRLQIPDDDVRTRLRRQLPSNIFVQYLAGPQDVRSGVTGLMLRAIAWISLVIGPIALLVFFQLRFLPYHHEVITWWHRIAIVADLALLWLLWPSIARGGTIAHAWRGMNRGMAAAIAALSLVPILLTFTIATFPGEWLENHLPANALHKSLVVGTVDLTTRQPTSLLTNRLVLPALNVGDHAKPDSEAKSGVTPEVISLRGRHLEGAVLSGADLRKSDLTGAQLQGASLDSADLRDVVFGCEHQKTAIASQDNDGTHAIVVQEVCANLAGASLSGALMQGALLDGADLREARLNGTQLQGASLEATSLQRASLDGAKLRFAAMSRAQLQGSSLKGTDLSGSSLLYADMRAATFRGARLQGANLGGARLEATSISQTTFSGAAMDGASLEGADLNEVEFQGVALSDTSVAGASFQRVIVWRASLPHRVQRLLINGSNPAAKLYCVKPTRQLALPTCDWTAEVYDNLKRDMTNGTLDNNPTSAALKRITERLDPGAGGSKTDEEAAEAWAALEKASPPPDEFMKGIVGLWVNAACRDSNISYVARAMVDRFDAYFGSESTLPAELAASLLDPKACLEEKNLTADTRARLKAIRDQGVQSTKP